MVLLAPNFRSLPPEANDFGMVETTELNDDAELDWDALEEYVYSILGTKQLSTEGKRQSTFVDFGYCGGRSYSRDSNGLTHPSLLKNTNDFIATTMLVTLSRQLQHHVPHLWKTISEERMKYSRAINIDNIIEYVRVAVTDVVDPMENIDVATCSMHGDDKNCTIFTEVAIFSKVRWYGNRGKRRSIICATRKSCADSVI